MEHTAHITRCHYQICVGSLRPVHHHSVLYCSNSSSNCFFCHSVGCHTATLPHCPAARLTLFNENSVSFVQSTKGTPCCRSNWTSSTWALLVASLCRNNCASLGQRLLTIACNYLAVCGAAAQPGRCLGQNLGQGFQPSELALVSPFYKHMRRTT